MANKAIVFIHGFNHDHRCWEPVMRYLHEGYPTVLTCAVDMPGRGEKKFEKAPSGADIHRLRHPAPRAKPQRKEWAIASFSAYCSFTNAIISSYTAR